MLMRRIIGITGIGLWAGLIVFAVVAGLEGDNVELAKKAINESGNEPTFIETMAKDFVKLLVNGDYAKAVENFDSTMKKVMPAENLQQVWNSIVAQSGSFVKQLGTRRQKIIGYDIIFVTCKFERAILDTKVVFNRKKQIAGLFFVPSQESAK